MLVNVASDIAAILGKLAQFKEFYDEYSLQIDESQIILRTLRQLLSGRENVAALRDSLIQIELESVFRQLQNVVEEFDIVINGFRHDYDVTGNDTKPTPKKSGALISASRKSRAFARKVCAAAKAKDKIEEIGQYAKRLENIITMAHLETSTLQARRLGQLTGQNAADILADVSQDAQTFWTESFMARTAIPWSEFYDALHQWAGRHLESYLGQQNINIFVRCLKAKLRVRDDGAVVTVYAFRKVLLEYPDGSVAESLIRQVSSFDGLSRGPLASIVSAGHIGAVQHVEQVCAKCLVTFDNHNHVSIWNISRHTRSLELVGSLRTFEGRIISVAVILPPAGFHAASMVAVATEDCDMVRVYDVHRQELLHTIQLPGCVKCLRACIRATNINISTPLLAVALVKISYIPVFEFSDVSRSPVRLAALDGHAAAVCAISTVSLPSAEPGQSPSEALLVMTSDGEATIWDLCTLSTAHRFSTGGCCNAVTVVPFRPDCTVVLCASPNMLRVMTITPARPSNPSTQGSYREATFALPSVPDRHYETQHCVDVKSDRGAFCSVDSNGAIVAVQLAARFDMLRVCSSSVARVVTWVPLSALILHDRFVNETGTSFGDTRLSRIGATELLLETHFSATGQSFRTPLFSNSAHGLFGHDVITGDEAGTLRVINTLRHLQDGECPAHHPLHITKLPPTNTNVCLLCNRDIGPDCDVLACESRCFVSCMNCFTPTLTTGQLRVLRHDSTTLSDVLVVSQPPPRMTVFSGMHSWAAHCIPSGRTDVWGAFVLCPLPYGYLTACKGGHVAKWFKCGTFVAMLSPFHFSDASAGWDFRPAIEHVGHEKRFPVLLGCSSAATMCGEGAPVVTSMTRVKTFVKDLRMCLSVRLVIGSGSGHIGCFHGERLEGSYRYLCGESTCKICGKSVESFIERLCNICFVCHGRICPPQSLNIPNLVGEHQGAWVLVAPSKIEGSPLGRLVSALSSWKRRFLEIVPDPRDALGSLLLWHDAVPMESVEHLERTDTDAIKKHVKKAKGTLALDSRLSVSELSVKAMLREKCPLEKAAFGLRIASGQTTDAACGTYNESYLAFENAHDRQRIVDALQEDNLHPHSLCYVCVTKKKKSAAVLIRHRDMACSSCRQDLIKIKGAVIVCVASAHERLFVGIRTMQANFIEEFRVGSLQSGPRSKGTIPIFTGEIGGFAVIQESFLVAISGRATPCAIVYSLKNASTCAAQQPLCHLEKDGHVLSHIAAVEHTSRKLFCVAVAERREIHIHECVGQGSPLVARLSFAHSPSCSAVSCLHAFLDRRFGIVVMAGFHAGGILLWVVRNYHSLNTDASLKEPRGPELEMAGHRAAVTSIVAHNACIKSGSLDNTVHYWQLEELLRSRECSSRRTPFAVADIPSTSWTQSWSLYRHADRERNSPVLVGPEDNRLLDYVAHLLRDGSLEPGFSSPLQAMGSETAYAFSLEKTSDVNVHQLVARPTTSVVGADTVLVQSDQCFKGDCERTLTFKSAFEIGVNPRQHYPVVDKTNVLMPVHNLSDVCLRAGGAVVLPYRIKLTGDTFGVPHWTTTRLNVRAHFSPGEKVTTLAAQMVKIQTDDDQTYMLVENDLTKPQVKGAGDPAEGVAHAIVAHSTKSITFRFPPQSSVHAQNVTSYLLIRNVSEADDIVWISQEADMDAATLMVETGILSEVGLKNMEAQVPNPTALTETTTDDEIPIHELEPRVVACALCNTETQMDANKTFATCPHHPHLQLLERHSRSCDGCQSTMTVHNRRHCLRCGASRCIHCCKRKIIVDGNSVHICKTCERQHRV